METKHPKLEKSNEIVWSLEEEEEEDLSSHPKSYTCSFCKKGFSNAQALGGHMNIHRRDRAKLLGLSELSLNTVKSTNITPNQVEDRYLISEIVLESSEEGNISSPRRPCKVSMDGNSSSASSKGKDGIKENSRLVHGSSSQVELDLELRLGLGPDSRAL